MFSPRRRRFHDLMDELDRFIEDMERDLESTVKEVFESGKDLYSKPLIYGFSMQIGPDGVPILRTFGDKGALKDGSREPVHDQFVDESRGELKLFVELPGIMKEDIDVKSIETEAMISASHDDRKYNATIPLKSRVDPESASAVYKNGVLEVTFKLKDKANKGYTKLRVD